MIAVPLPPPEARQALPGKAARHLKRGDEALSTGDASRALEEYQQAKLAEESLKDPATKAHILWAIGAALHAAGRYEDALTHLEQAVDIDPKDAQLQVARGVILANLGRFEESIRSLDVALNIEDTAAVRTARREVLDVQLQGLVSSGFAMWSGQKPKGSKNPEKITPGPPVSDYVIQDRR